MDIKSSNLNFSKETTLPKPLVQNYPNSSTNFADELQELKTATEPEKEVRTDETPAQEEEKVEAPKEEKVGDAIEELNSTVKELNQLEEKEGEDVKKDAINADNEDMINKDFNIENKDLLPQMNPNMNFNSEGQPFTSFMNEDKYNKKLSASAADLAEEAAILSTMAENIAIANRNEMLMQTEKAKLSTTHNETAVRFDSIIMNKADVEVFSQLVQNGSVDMKNISTQGIEKSLQVSKALADMLAKSMEKNQPLRIDFDNNISVIIRISREGKLTADFLPSSQVAEAYLKENLPLLRQKFDNENIKYDELNQRERREHNKEQDKKKGRNDE